MDSFAKAIYDNISYELKILGFQTNFVEPFLFIISWNNSYMGILCNVSIYDDYISYETALWNNINNETIYDENMGYIEFKTFSNLDDVLEELCSVRRYLEINIIHVDYGDTISQQIKKLEL